MTLMETAKLMKLLQAAYPRFYTYADDVTRKNAVKIWQLSLEDMDYALAQKALVELIQTCKFTPTVADFREAAERITQCAQDVVVKNRHIVPKLQGTTSHTSP